MIGALGIKIVPAKYFGIVERFSVFAATGFNMVLGLHLFFDKNNSVIVNNISKIVNNGKKNEKSVSKN